ncbi:MAG: isoprenylcysteine carboxylmethyltransferase family protein [Candidatus Bathyarchaeia archaeon]
MLPETYIAAFLSACLSVFYVVNLYNLVRSRRRKEPSPFPISQETSETMQPPRDFLVLVAFGTLIFWLKSFLYPVLVFTDTIRYLDNSFLTSRFFSSVFVQVLGVVLSSVGYFIFTWSVIARERYSTAWEMSANHKLVTWGPYRYVRHPSYLAYFVLFFGLFFIWPTWTSLLPLVAIPGYVRVAEAEEKMLIHRFGDDYLVYQKEVGQFFPRFGKDKVGLHE